MRIDCIESLKDRPKADLLIVPFWEGAKPAASLDHFESKLEAVLKSGDFKGKPDEMMIVHWQGEPEVRVMLLGLGQEAKATPEVVRRAFGSAIRSLLNKKWKRIHAIMPQKSGLLDGFYEGIALANDPFSFAKENPPQAIEQIGLIGISDQESAHLKKLDLILDAVRWARLQVNRNPDEIDPKGLADAAVDLGKKHDLKVTVFESRELEKMNMSLLLAVGRAAENTSRLIEATYMGDPSTKERVVLVGKGITYDTGGLSLKPTDSMLTMKCDMAGAAAVLGAVAAAAALNLKINVTALAPCAENCIDGKSYKLGNVYRSHSGKTVEINNTDAEGRLVLADALSYAVETLHPSCMIDLATLTGAAVVALGEDFAPFFATEEKLANELQQASNHTAEAIWRLPLHTEYKDAFKSEIADMTNSGGRDAGCIKAALFLHAFVKNVPWAHLDIAGPAFLSKPASYHPVRGTGFGVRLLVSFLEERTKR